MRVSMVVLALFLVVATAAASDVWVLQGLAVGPPINSCEFYGWSGKVLFHNSNPSEITVSLIGVSDGQLPALGREMRVPAGGTAAAPSLWQPTPFPPPLWVMHLDVPDGVIVESRIEITTLSCVLAPPLAQPDRGKLSLPVWRGLQPAGTSKVFLGTDLASTDARNNVVVYNAGPAEAHAHIEVHRGCDDVLLDSRDVLLAPNSAKQVTGLAGTAGCSTTASLPGYVVYVSVTVDQPAASWVSTVANGKPVVVSYGVNGSSP